MDIRLLMDGGASPPAPPGKSVESPPPREEFEKTLQTARKEETPGEVAENEPNAQLQKLDSEKKEAEAKDSVKPGCAPIQIDPAILAQLQQVGIAPLDAPTPALPVNLSWTPTPTAVVESINPASLATNDTKATADQSAVPKLDATKNEALTALVASAFQAPATQNTSSPVTEPKLNALLAQSKAYAGDDKQLQSSMFKAPDAKDLLNVTSVQSSTTEISAQLDASAKTLVTPIVVTKDVKSPVGVDSKSANIGEVAEKAVIAVKAETSQDSSSSEKGKDQPSNPMPEMQATVQTSDAAPTSQPATNHQMTATERQAMITSISKKIDELAIRSVRNEVRVEMQPPELGSVVVSIRKDLAGLTATLNASNEPLRQALHESRNDLAGALGDRNVGQVRIEVRGASADTMNMGQQFSQAQSQDQNQQNQTKQAANAANRFLADQPEAKTDQPAPRLAQTTLLDLEI